MGKHWILRAWLDFTRSRTEYLEEQLRWADEHNAPADAIYARTQRDAEGKRSFKEWVRLAEIEATNPSFGEFLRDKAVEMQRASNLRN